MATDSNKSTATGGTSSGGQGAKDAKETAKQVAGEARSTAKELGREAMDQAKSTAGYVREQAKSSVEQGKSQVADQVGGLAKAFHKSSEELRNEEMGRLADQSEWLAGRIEELQNYLQNRSTTELLDDLRGAARSQPAWFLGGMFAAGLLAARFVHSSSAEDHSGRMSGSQTRYATTASESYRTADTTRP
ncbi:MAG TPA: hypothetical protein VF168_08260 [Trueperaceae bacterium]